LSKDEKEKLNYHENLVERYSSLPQVKRIQRFHHLPKRLYQEKKIYQEEREALDKQEFRDLKYGRKKVDKIEKKTPMKRNFNSVEY
jgi:DDB1- and CUL4-associated factor 13